MDCILASYTEIVTQHRAIDIGLPDHQLIYLLKKSLELREDLMKK